MIHNSSKNTVLAKKIRYCDTFLKRGTGLMFRFRFRDEGYIFSFKRDIIAAIHMLFVFFPIDIIWLDEKKQVVEMRENIWPFTLSVIPNRKSRYFIEVPKNTIKKTRTAVGDQLGWTEKKEK
ncbi:MAG: DUF192 domain-containing protein [Nanoarchaeota archaeon]